MREIEHLGLFHRWYHMVVTQAETRMEISVSLKVEMLWDFNVNERESGTEAVRGPTCQSGAPQEDSLGSPRPGNHCLHSSLF